MLFAQETTVENHRFNHSRKKPPRVTAKASCQQDTYRQDTYRQDTFLADMLHETTPAQRKHAHAVCGSTAVFNVKGGARLYCNRRDCPYCFKRRYRKIAARIRGYKISTGNKLYWWRIPSDAHAKAVREIKRRDGDYVCMPMINKHGVEQEILICSLPANTPGTQPLHTDHPRLETNLAVWTRTPTGKRVSFSSGFRQKDLSPDMEKSTNYFAKTSLDKIIPYAIAVGGRIDNVTKSYAKWRNVDPEKLTTKLNEDNIVAYQITFPTLNEEARNAEDIIAEAQRNTELQNTELQNTELNPDYGAVPLNSKGRAVALPVKLRQVLRESIGIGLHNNSSVDPLLDEKTASGLHPPPG